MSSGGLQFSARIYRVKFKHCNTGFLFDKTFRAETLDSAVEFAQQEFPMHKIINVLRTV